MRTLKIDSALVLFHQYPSDKVGFESPMWYVVGEWDCEHSIGYLYVRYTARRVYKTLNGFEGALQRYYDCRISIEELI